MTKKDVKDWKGLVLFAGIRAKGSAKRNDPWAWAYWRNTSRWAEQMQKDDYTRDPGNWASIMRGYLAQAKTFGVADCTNAALHYSRAKWLAIMLRNRGVRISRTEGPSLKWLHGIEGQSLLFEAFLQSGGRS